MFVGTAYACDTNQIDVLGDGTQCETTKFSLTTTNLTVNDTFNFSISATGTFYVDCGADGVLSGTGASGSTITRSDTTPTTYTCTYSSANAKTIRFGGSATGYNTNTSTAVIIFYVGADDTAKSANSAKIASISGNLSNMFPYISSNSASDAQPRFYETFRNAINMTSVPNTLFAYYNTGSTHMFRNTFRECAGLKTIYAELFSNISRVADFTFTDTFNSCTGLTTIPNGLFSNVKNAGHSVFYGTFDTCTGITSIPNGLFSKITTAGTSMFQNTFRNCTSLTSIPSELFAGIKTSAVSLFQNTFSNCTALSTIPSDIFSGFTRGAAGMFFGTFSNCTALTSIPAGLFSGITTGATRMFYSTFSNTSLETLPENLFNGITTSGEAMFQYTFYMCRQLSGYISPTIFAGLIAHGSPTSQNMWDGTFVLTKLMTSCSSDKMPYHTGYEQHWGNKVSCQNIVPITCTPGKYFSASDALCHDCLNNHYCSGGTFTYDGTDMGLSACASGLYSPAGMWESAQCGRILHIGDAAVYLRSVKKTTPSLNIDIDNDGTPDFFGNMTTSEVVMSNGTTRKLKLQYGGNTYSVYDDSVNIPNSE